MPEKYSEHFAVSLYFMTGHSFASVILNTGFYVMTVGWRPDIKEGKT